VLDLLRIQLALGEVTPRAVQAHAQAQTFGFLVRFPVSAILRAAESFANLWGMPSLLWVSAASGLLAAAAFVAPGGCVGATLLMSRRSLTPSN